MHIDYRALDNSEHVFLEEMLWEALFVPQGASPHSKAILKEPSIRKYIENWGMASSDKAIVALVDNNLIAAIWGRCFVEESKGYGFVDQGIPEIAMAVQKEYRNIGIGTELLKQIELQYKQAGHNGISLSVHILNPAKELYLKNGYRKYEALENAWTMLKTF